MILPCEIIISDPQVDPIFEDSHLEDIFQIHFQSQKVRILILKLYFWKKYCLEQKTALQYFSITNQKVND